MDNDSLAHKIWECKHRIVFVLFGDVTEDGIVNLADLCEMRDYLLGTQNIDQIQFCTTKVRFLSKKAQNKSGSNKSYSQRCVT